MDADEKAWIEDAIRLLAAAKRENVTVLYFRRQDANDGADIIMTNATSPEMVAALNGDYEPPEEEN